jgi:hypothetical protein
MIAAAAFANLASIQVGPNAKACRRDGGEAYNTTGTGAMLKSVYAIAAAAIVAAAFITTLSLTQPVEARGTAPGAKADRADLRPLARDCSQNAWPYFEAACLRDARNRYGEARQVRVVSSDHFAR